MIVSPPILLTRNADEHDDQWIDRCMSGDAPGSGAYPLSHELEWHGGLHLSAPRAGTNVEELRAIADGKVVYLRAPTTVDEKEEQHPLNYHNGYTSNGCIVIEHTFDICKGADGPFTFYSVYHHVAKPSEKLALNKPVRRREQIAHAGRIYGEKDRFHFEICCDDSNLAKLVGRKDSLLPMTANGRTDLVFGEIYFSVPAGTPLFAIEPSPLRSDGQVVIMPVTGSPTATASGDISPIHVTKSAIIIGWRHGSGIATAAGGGGFTAYRNDGSIIAHVPNAQPEYELYRTARQIVAAWKTAKATAPLDYPHVPEFDAMCELMRFGRIVHPEDRSLTPTDTPHWRKVPYEGGEAWINLNAENIKKFSDGDFPHWRAWRLIDDDSAANDCKCDSAVIKKLLLKQSEEVGRDRQHEDALDAPNIQVQLKHAICKFPSEWEVATLEARWSWLKTKTDRNPKPFDDQEYQGLVEHLKALCFDCPPLFAAQWRFDPREFVKFFRRCGWAAVSHRISKAVSSGRLPTTTGMSTDLKTDMYVRMMLEAADALKSGDLKFGHNVRAAFTQGDAIEFGLRIPTDPSANNGRGSWDDLMVVLQQQDGDTVKIIAETNFTADPAGSYQDGRERPAYWGAGRGGKAALPQKDTPDADKDGYSDLGRIHEGIYAFCWDNRPNKGPNVYTNDAGHSFNVLKPTSKLPAERYFNSAWHFDIHSCINDPNSPYLDNYTMLQHAGYANFTGSAGCQTFPYKSIDGETSLSFADFAKKISATKQHKFIYVLKNL